MTVWFKGQPLATKPTANDIAILANLLEKERAVCSHEELGGHLWTGSIDPMLVHKFMSRLKRKLPGDLAASIVSVRGVGYRLDSGVATGESEPDLNVRRARHLLPLAAMLGVGLAIVVIGYSIVRLTTSEANIVTRDDTDPPAGELLVSEDFSSPKPVGPAETLKPNAPDRLRER